MNCIFGHKFGETKGDHQYCTKCGKAILVPVRHPCDNGHIWVTESESHVTGFGWDDIKVSQFCSRCTEHRTICKFDNQSEVSF